MSETLLCFRCGASLEKLTPPLSQRDMCPACSVHLHVCAMCVNYDPGVPKACREDDAEEVTDKEKMNFCAWFAPSPDAFDPKRAAAADKARSELGALFGEPVECDAGEDPLRDAAEKLFK